jgi:hypothetical protein
VLDDRDREQRAERDRGRERLAGCPRLRARPERDQRGEAGQRHAAPDQRDPHPLVDPAVGHGDRRQRLDPLREAGRELVPVARPEQAHGHAGDEQREEDQAERRGDRAGGAHGVAVVAPGDEQQAARAGRRDHAQQHRALRLRREKRAPLQRAEHRQRHEADEPRDPGARERPGRRRLARRRPRGADPDRVRRHHATSAAARWPDSS